MQAWYLIVVFAWVYNWCTKLRLAGLGHKILVVFESQQRYYNTKITKWQDVFKKSSKRYFKKLIKTKESVFIKC